MYEEIERLEKHTITEKKEKKIAMRRKSARIIELEMGEAESSPHFRFQRFHHLLDIKDNEIDGFLKQKREVFETLMFPH